MLITSPILSFQSSAFPVADGEDVETNPGIFGKALAEWVSRHLNDRGVGAQPPYAEDWGWCVEVTGHKYPTGLACASDDGEKTSWRVYAFQDLGLLGGFRGRGASVRAVNELIEIVKDLLSKEGTVTNLRTDEE